VPVGAPIDVRDCPRKVIASRRISAFLHSPLTSVRCSGVPKPSFGDPPMPDDVRAWAGSSSGRLSQRKTSWTVFTSEQVGAIRRANPLPSAPSPVDARFISACRCWASSIWCCSSAGAAPASSKRAFDREIGRWISSPHRGCMLSGSHSSSRALVGILFWRTLSLRLNRLTAIGVRALGVCRRPLGILGARDDSARSTPRPMATAATVRTPNLALAHHPHLRQRRAACRRIPPNGS